jgi:hypothetical protein
MDHREKLRRAKYHLVTLRAGVTRYIADSDAHALTARFDPERQKYVATLRVRNTPPTEWSLVVGDVLHNARSSLDAITYQLAAQALSRALSEDEVKQIQFVIVDVPENWNGERGRRLPHVHPDAQRAMEALQPYHRTDRRFRHPLSVL